MVQNIQKCGNIHRYVGGGGNICIGDCATDVRNNIHFHFHSFTISLLAGMWFEEESIGFKVYHWFIMYFLQMIDTDCFFDFLDIWMYNIYPSTIPLWPESDLKKYQVTLVSNTRRNIFQLVSFPSSIYFGYFFLSILSITFNNCLFTNTLLKISQRLNHLHFNWIYGGHAAVGFWVLAAMRSRSAAAAHKCPNALQQCLTEWAPLNTYLSCCKWILHSKSILHFAYCTSVPTPCSSVSLSELLRTLLATLQVRIA